MVTLPLRLQEGLWILGWETRRWRRPSGKEDRVPCLLPSAHTCGGGFLACPRCCRHRGEVRKGLCACCAAQGLQAHQRELWT